MKKTVCASLDSELVNRALKFANNTHRTFSGVIEMSLQKFLDDSYDGRD